MNKPETNEQPNTKTNRPGKKTLTGIVGAAAAALLFVVVPKFEGNVNVGYLDPIGIPTKCAGDTANVIVGKYYSDAECKESTEQALIKHAEPVLKCVPSLKGNTFGTVAAVSFAYNIGNAAFCNSTAARKFNAGDYMGACAEFSRWTRAGGKELPGLVKRRAEERALCEKGFNHVAQSMRFDKASVFQTG